MNPNNPRIPGGRGYRRHGRLFAMFIALVLVVGAIAWVKAVNRKRLVDPDDPSQWTNMPALGQPPNQNEIKNVAPGSTENPDLEPVTSMRRAAFIGLAARTGHVIPFDITLTQKDVDDALQAPAVVGELRKQGISAVGVALSKSGDGMVTIQYTDHGNPVNAKGLVTMRNGRPYFSARPGTKNGSAAEARINEVLARLPITLDQAQVTDGTLLVDGKSRTVTATR